MHPTTVLELATPPRDNVAALSVYRMIGFAGSGRRGAVLAVCQKLVFACHLTECGGSGPIGQVGSETAALGRKLAQMRSVQVIFHWHDCNPATKTIG